MLLHLRERLIDQHISTVLSVLCAISFFLMPTRAYAEMGYEECQVGDNDYLESTIGKILPTTTRNTSSEVISSFPMECVYWSMASAPKDSDKVLYGACEKDQFFARRPECESRNCRYSRPCLSRKYHELVYEKFIESMKCLGLDPKETFALFHIQSRFQMNVGDQFGDWGVARLSRDATLHVKDSEDYRSILRKNQCAAVRGIASIPVTMDVDRCERISGPENPARGFLYGGYLYLKHKEKATHLVREFSQRRKKSGGDEILEPDQLRMSVELAHYMYMMGGGDITATFKAFGEEALGVENAKVQEKMHQYLAQYFGASTEEFIRRPSKLKYSRKVIAKYFTVMAQEMKLINSKVNEVPRLALARNRSVASGIIEEGRPRCSFTFE